jgi:hypothetical protein
MIKEVLYTLIASSISLGAFAQKSDGTTKSLIDAEKSFAEMAVKSGTKAAFNTFAAADGISFLPNPVNSKEYYNAHPDMKNLSWFPVYGRVSKSGDWGFTTGRYEMQGQEVGYGDFVSVWKTINAAFSGFLNPNARLIFPGREPIIGKEKINAFYNQMVAKVSFKTTSADKALGGDLAYTYGIATVDYKADLRESFNYVNIYELQPDHNWNIILQIYAPAER